MDSTGAQMTEDTGKITNPYVYLENWGTFNLPDTMNYIESTLKDSYNNKTIHVINAYVQNGIFSANLGSEYSVKQLQVPYNTTYAYEDTTSGEWYVVQVTQLPEGDIANNFSVKIPVTIDYTSLLNELATQLNVNILPQYVSLSKVDNTNMGSLYTTTNEAQQNYYVTDYSRGTTNSSALQVYWSFDMGQLSQKGTVISDQDSVNNLMLQQDSSNYFYNGATYLNNALHLNGGNGQYLTANNSPFISLDSYSISFGVRIDNLTSLNPKNYIVSKGDNYSIFIDGNGYLNVQGCQTITTTCINNQIVTDTVNHRVTGTGGLNDDNWHSVLLTVDRSTTGYTLKIYIDNSLDVTVSNFYIALDTGSKLAIGVQLNNPSLNQPVATTYFTGDIDELKIYRNIITLSNTDFYSDSFDNSQIDDFWNASSTTGTLNFAEEAGMLKLQSTDINASENATVTQKVSTGKTDLSGFFKIYWNYTGTGTAKILLHFIDGNGNDAVIGYNTQNLIFNSTTVSDSDTFNFRWLRVQLIGTTLSLQDGGSGTYPDTWTTITTKMMDTNGIRQIKIEFEVDNANVGDYVAITEALLNSTTTTLSSAESYGKTFGSQPRLIWPSRQTTSSLDLQDTMKINLNQLAEYDGIGVLIRYFGTISIQIGILPKVTTGSMVYLQAEVVPFNATVDTPSINYKVIIFDNTTTPQTNITTMYDPGDLQLRSYSFSMTDFKLADGTTPKPNDYVKALSVVKTAPLNEYTPLVNIGAIDIQDARGFSMYSQVYLAFDDAKYGLVTDYILLASEDSVNNTSNGTVSSEYIENYVKKYYMIKTGMGSLIEFNANAIPYYGTNYSANPTPNVDTFATLGGSDVVVNVMQNPFADMKVIGLGYLTAREFNDNGLYLGTITIPFNSTNETSEQE